MKFFAFSQIALLILASCSDFYQNPFSMKISEPNGVKTCWSADMVREERQHVNQSNYEEFTRNLEAMKLKPVENADLVDITECPEISKMPCTRESCTPSYNPGDTLICNHVGVEKKPVKVIYAGQISISYKAVQLHWLNNSTW
jgi:hypothetical protein